jgi:hypothetical protein
LEVLAKSGYLYPIKEETFEYLAGRRDKTPRKMNFFPMVEHCQNPQVIGGGKKAGILWNLWEKMHRKKSLETEKLVSLAYQALQPHPKWKNLADECIWHKLVGLQDVKNHLVPPYLALHARVSTFHINDP